MKCSMCVFESRSLWFEPYTSHSVPHWGHHEIVSRHLLINEGAPSIFFQAQQNRLLDHRQVILLRNPPSQNWYPRHEIECHELSNPYDLAWRMRIKQFPATPRQEVERGPWNERDFVTVDSCGRWRNERLGTESSETRIWLTGAMVERCWKFWISMRLTREIEMDNLQSHRSPYKFNSARQDES